jgi:hypothetical protein
MIRLLPLPVRMRAVLVPALAGLILGSLPGVGLLLWSGHRAPIVQHGAAGIASGFDVLPNTAAYRVKSSSWENPNG